MNRRWTLSSLAYSGIFLLTLTLVSPTTIVCQSSVDSDTAELQRLEKIWNESHERDDADALNSLWADDMEVAVPKMPVMHKADVLKFARSGRMKFLRYQTSDTRIRLYGDAAVVTGRLQRTRVMNGQELSDDWRFTKTYVRQAGHWSVVSFHASEAAPQ
jgi:ketosteroid isomerase-like protein